MNTTEILMDVICENAGTTCTNCGFCGRTWFTREDMDFDGLKAKTKANPEKYAESSEDSLAFGWLDGKQVVYGCCEDKLKRYAEWIWSNREIIAAYLNRRAKAELEEATRNFESVGLLPKGR